MLHIVADLLGLLDYFDEEVVTSIFTSYDPDQSLQFLLLRYLM